MTAAPPDQTRAAEIAGRLPPFLRQMMLGDYDAEFASTADASELIRLGLWAWDPEKQDPESEYYEMEVTDLGYAVRTHLQGISHADRK